MKSQKNTPGNRQPCNCKASVHRGTPTISAGQQNMPSRNAERRSRQYCRNPPSPPQATRCTKICGSLAGPQITHARPENGTVNMNAPQPLERQPDCTAFQRNRRCAHAGNGRTLVTRAGKLCTTIHRQWNRTLIPVQVNLPWSCPSHVPAATHHTSSSTRPGADLKQALAAADCPDPRGIAGHPPGQTHGCWRSRFQHSGTALQKFPGT